MSDKNDQTTTARDLSGDHTVQPSARGGETGRIMAGRQCIAASIVIGAKTRSDREGDARERKAKEEAILEKYARHEDIWFDHAELLRSLYYLAEGTESKVYHDPNEPACVVKLTPIPYVLGADSSVLRFFDDKLALHNSLPSTAAYELVGFSRDHGNGNFLAVLRQPFVQGEEIIDVEPEFVSLMQRAGFLRKPTGGYQSGNVSVKDIDTHNVVKEPNGQYVIFDPIVSLVDGMGYLPIQIISADRPEQS